MDEASTELIHKASETKDTHESRQSLWMVIASPTIWAVHFLSCYLSVAIWCAKFASGERGLGGIRAAIGIYTMVALVGISLVGISGFRRHTFGNTTGPHDFDSQESRHRFLGFATLLLSVLSAVATLFVASTAIFFDRCD